MSGISKSVQVFAPAKINLCLHVTGRRDDGYHLIDTLVSFGPVGDRLRLVSANTLSLTVEGAEAAGVPGDMDNLVLRAAALFGEPGVAMTLEKFLPAASGIGGGSADAAAAYRGMLVWDDATSTALAGASDAEFREHAKKLLGLGADVPMCLMSAPLRARGIGERIEAVTLPDLPAVLINPRLPVATPEVFATLAQRNNAPLPDDLPAFADAAALTGWLATQRNDLETPACALQPEISGVLQALREEPGCALARMSGSGATCFGLFEDVAAAQAAARRLYAAHADWWVAGGVLGDQSALAAPRLS